MVISEFVNQLNEWGRQRIPFLFLIDYEMEKPMAWRIEEIDSNELLYSIHGFSNASTMPEENNFSIQSYPYSFNHYKEKFDRVYQHLQYGDTFLTNLTIKTKIEIDLSLRDLFYISHARYKVWLKNKFLFFSPEIFIQIKDGMIYSFPMKGTMDAAIPDAKEMLLQNKKEMAEHVTIVDLIRNDLSQVAKHVSISRFRYLEEITTREKKLLQVSSEIKGELASDYHTHLGDIICSLLPAGSISGAPKPKTLEIIAQAEREKRGYYTGIAGHFDGKNLDSGVMIRFIEQDGNDFYYRSGGGITTQSNVHEEYQELLNKIYVPVA